jgi:hypothetical protein
MQNIFLVYQWLSISLQICHSFCNLVYHFISAHNLLLQDLGNYTCIAENIAGKRISPDIEVTLYGNI